MYRLSVYYVCNTLCDMVAHVFYPTFFMIIVYFMAGFKQTVACFFLTLFVVLLIAITSQGAGELFRAAVMSIKRAGMAASLILTTATQLVKIEDRKDTKHYIELEPLPKSRTETKPITIQSKCFDDDGRVKRTGTFWTATTHIITAVIGSGVLSLSWAIAQLGWAVGPVVMLLFAVINLYTSSLLTQCYRTDDSVTGSRNYTYPDAVKSILAPKGSLITNLPGFNGSLPSKQYGGYVTVDESHGKNLYYYFVESEGNSSKDPIVLWLNGGPGCSSLDGFIYEHGPFNFEKPVTKGALPKLKLNPYSWSKVSNVIYLDSPAGVGFSYSKNISDYITGDKKTASDAHIFLLKWFELYPEYLTNPLFLAGESYAGVYVPTLADKIVQGIEVGTKPKLNFKGYLIGNPVADPIFDGNALVPFAHGMGLISDQIFENTTKACNGTFYPPDSIACSNLLLKVDNKIKHLNIYDILEPCYHGDETEENQKNNYKLPLSFRQLGKTEKSLPIRKRMFGRAWPYGAIVKDGIVPSWPQLISKSLRAPPCTDDEIAMVWLNNPDVRRAIHAVEKSVVSEWDLCTDKLEYDHDLGSMIPYHKNLTSKGYSALIFSGDHDMCVPFTGTQAWTRSLGYNIVDEWRPWLVNDQVAGFTQGYANNLRFLTVKGSGHTVPEYKPEEALYFYTHFLDGTPI